MDIDELILKSVSGEQLKDIEAKKLQDWLNESATHKKQFEQIQGYWENKKFQDFDITNTAWDKIEEHINGKDLDTRHVNYNPSKKNGRLFFSIAVSIALLVCSGLYFVITYNNVQDVSDLKANIVTKKNSKGEKRSIKLPDGTLVKLNSESKLTFPESFDDSIREVQLEGEAFFDVTEDKERPFIVKSDHISTYVKGTSFNVRAYKSERLISVSVLTGIVDVIDVEENKKIQLVAQEMAGYSIQAGKLKKGTFNASNIAWKDGILIFEGAPPKEVMARLERWYGVNISVKSQSLLKRKSLSGSFENQSLEEVLEAISFSGDFKFEINGKNVTIY